MSPPNEFQKLPAETQLEHLGVTFEEEVEYLTIYRINEHTWGSKSTSRNFPSFGHETIDQVLNVAAQGGWEQMDRPVPWSDVYVFKRHQA
jgi:hypothetical protein